VRFDPDGLYLRSEPIRVRVAPLLRAIEGLRCRLSVRGSNIDTLGQDLEWKGGEFDGLLTVPAAHEGSKNPEAYTVALSLEAPDGKVVWQDRYPLPVREGALPTVESAREPGAMMRDRYLFGNRAESSDVREIKVKEDEQAKSPVVDPHNVLSELAKDIKLRRPAGQEGVTISNRNLLSLGFLIDPANYASIPEDLRDVATEYDQREFELRELRRSIDAINAARGYTASREGQEPIGVRQSAEPDADLAGAQVRYQFLDANQLVIRLNLLATRLVEARLCRCNDGTWHRQDGKPTCAPCAAPVPNSF
jgi:hypothetical protein